ncbi:MAG TPA: biotin/lipoyl-containing protein [Chthonomonas sp.]|uniref:acetyl-CoA carboxylase biotin carboxyl carrier protein subunit n=1 Tax=Chthonomonas sp. TaxID=2282153 RepID=UPI002B4B6830|nr:biotin/lipoyl-containing protein [Chthonomonas sp.]HLI47844.1 biotin/lipoyl-containing protein [Chthonomonas sp.]
MRYNYRLEEAAENLLSLDLEAEGEIYKVTLPNGQSYRVRLRRVGMATQLMPWVEIALCDADGQPERLLRVPVVDLDGRIAVSWKGRVYLFERMEEGGGRPETYGERATEGKGVGLEGKGGLVRAPMVGVVSEVLVSEGQLVEKEQPLLVLEAMKVVMRIGAPCAGQVKRLWVQAGQLVSHGEPLVELVEE